MEPWKVSTNPIGDKKIYEVFRIINTNEIVHAGNREVVGFFETRKEAEEKAKALNEGGVIQKNESYG